ncbi:hypothetical protein Tco_0988348 [Tanacetum coccineum]|uniref:Uncharacterized protein n=1 Tax=Tanacetum coccineum TaxID=301880 RepID=A0ABQ5ER27_9ASTR
MIVQAQEQVGGGSKIPTDSHHTPTTTQPSTSKPQKKQSRRKQRKDTEDPQLSGPIKPVPDDTENVASVPTHSNDPLLMRVKKFEGKRKSKPPWMRRLYKVGRSARMISSKDEGLGAQEDASKQERKIADIDADVEMWLKGILQQATTAVTKPEARGVVVQEPNVELEEEEKLARQREEDANIAKWDNVQAMIDTDYELASRRAEKKTMSTYLKNMAGYKSYEDTSKDQKRNTMSTYLKNMAGYKHNQLKTKSFEDIQMLFDKELKRVTTLKTLDTELGESILRQEQKEVPKDR